MMLFLCVGNSQFCSRTQYIAGQIFERESISRYNGALSNPVIGKQGGPQGTREMIERWKVAVSKLFKDLKILENVGDFNTGIISDLPGLRRGGCQRSLLSLAFVCLFTVLWYWNLLMSTDMVPAGSSVIPTLSGLAWGHPRGCR